MNQNERQKAFEKVYNRVNNARHKQGGGTLSYDRLGGILDEEGLSKHHWYQALSWARVHSPNLYQLFYAAFGRKPRQQKAAETVVDNEFYELDREPEEEEMPPVDPEGVISAAESLAGVISWLEPLADKERLRVLAAAEVFFA